VLPSPLKRNPTAPTQYMLSYQQRVLKNMRNIGKIYFSEKEKPAKGKNPSKK
jgi:membrane peptidoglycan carboxypeptidase